MVVTALLRLALSAACCGWTSDGAEREGVGVLRVVPHVFQPRGAEPVDAELGELRVPENRTNPRSRNITLRMVRFRSTARRPGSPIVYLAGGPGGSGIDAARGPRFRLFMALREIADVIALDQRGTGTSDARLGCEESFLAPLGRPLDRATAGEVLSRAVARCADRHRAAGVDLAGYNTRESAADLEDLRRALGVTKLSLWGISYGTHLALATMKAYPGSVDRAVLAGVEPLHHTLKLPSDQQALLEEIAKLSRRDPRVGRSAPDLLRSIAGLLRRLGERPERVTLTHPETGLTAEISLGPLDLQWVLAGLMSGPESFGALPDLVTRLEAGDWPALALRAAPARIGRAPGLMGVAVDCASGASVEWTDRIRREAATALLGDAINLPYPEVCSGIGVPDLGDAFRAPFDSPVPSLLISGTLDGRTPPGNAETVLRRLKNGHHLVIDGAGHSDPLLLSSPKTLDALKGFLQGRTSGLSRIVADRPVAFTPVRTVATVSEATLARYVGRYSVPGGDLREVIKAGAILYTRRGSGAAQPIRPESETEFFYESFDARVRFELDPEGNASAMVVYQPGETEGRRAPRVR
jgi:pimeloyl-ACP methyl ester carboxylesterase